MTRKTTRASMKAFKTHLREGEEIRWFGEPSMNVWRLNYNPFLNLLGKFLGFILSIILPIIFYIGVFFLIGLVSIGPLLLGLSLALFLYGSVSSQFAEQLLRLGFFGCVTGMFLSVFIINRAYKLKIKLPKIRLYLTPMLIPLLGEYSHYAITNQRVMISERGNILDYSLLLMADAAVGKPHDGASTIHIYNSTNPTGQLPEPVFELNDIAEEEAQAAYEILRMAREEALEERAREMGID